MPAVRFRDEWVIDSSPRRCCGEPCFAFALGVPARDPAHPRSHPERCCVVSHKAHTKATARRSRTIDVPRVTAQELREWRLESGRPDDGTPIIGEPNPEAVKTWARRHLSVQAERATGRDDVTLYTLRHTHASLCHYAGLTVPEAARRLGHSPALHVATYAHVIDGLQGNALTALTH